MARRLAVAIAIGCVLALCVWAGAVNLRARRAAMQQAEQAHITILKSSGASPADAGNDGVPGAVAESLRGKPAPAFTLTSTEGKKVSLGDYKGRPVVVNFWAVYCGPCKLEMPFFEQLQKQYAKDGLVVLGIDQDDGMAPGEVASSAAHLGVSYPILLPQESIDKKYGGVDYLPQTFYIDRTGNVVSATAGGRSRDEIEANIRKALAAGA